MAGLNAPALALADVTVGYGRRPAAHHVTAAAPAGSLVAVVGPNGAGKSTLLRAIAGEVRPMAGRIDRGGLKRRAIAYMPQQAGIERRFPITVGDLVGAGLWAGRGLFGGLDRGDRDRIAAALEAVGLRGFAGRMIATLSGGQLQRALFARVILQDARLILLDEPFAAVDPRTASRLVELLLGWGGEGRTVLAAMHDLDMVRAHFPLTLLLARTQIGFGETGAVLTPGNLLKARRMGEAWRADAALCEGDHPPGGHDHPE